MNQEEKKLLLIDLCARLPYDNTYVQYTGNVPEGLGAVKLNHEIIKIIETLPEELNITIKPYLRPMSSMTEEEKIKYQQLKNQLVCQINTVKNDNLWKQNYIVDLDEDSINIVDWLNSHHFDYRGLIEKGLAIDSTNKYYTSNEKI